MKIRKGSTVKIDRNFYVESKEMDDIL